MPKLKKDMEREAAQERERPKTENLEEVLVLLRRLHVKVDSLINDLRNGTIGNKNEIRNAHGVYDDDIPF